MRTKLFLPALLLALLLPACVATQDKALEARSPKEGEQGINVGTDINAAFGNVNVNLDNVGSYSSVPEGWTGPIPPGWTPNNVEIAKAAAEQARAEAERAKAELELERLRRSGEAAPEPE